MANVLISGVSGFLGTTIARKLLKNNHTVYGLVRIGSVLPKDIEDDSLFKRLQIEEGWHLQLIDIGFESFYHLAASYEEGNETEDLSKFLYANIFLGVEMLMVAKMQQKKSPAFIYAQSYWQYFKGGNDFYPNTLYAATKESFHALATYYCKMQEVRTLGLVVYDTYGPNDKREKFLNALANHFFPKGAHNATSAFPASSGKQQVSISHIDDVANGFIQAQKLLENFPPEALLSRYHLRNQKTKSLKSFVNDLLHALKLDAEKITWSEIEHKKSQVFSLSCGSILPGWTEKKKIELEFESLAEK